MNRSLFFAICVVLCLSTIASAQTSSIKKLWPFGANKKSVKNDRLPSMNPFLQKKPTPKPTGYGPSAMMSRLERGTDAMFSRTQKTVKGVQKMGRSMNPFAAKPYGQKKKSFWQTGFSPKRPDAPVTVKEFMSLPRPDF